MPPETIHPTVCYKWLKDFMEAEKRRHGGRGHRRGSGELSAQMVVRKLMSVERLGARHTARQTREVLSWPRLIFAERSTSALDPSGQRRVLNLSAPDTLASAVSGLLKALGIGSILATPPVDWTLTEDARGNEIKRDSRRDTPWRRVRTMKRRIAPDHLTALLSLFDEAQVRRGFYGGIRARGQDCSRVARLLTIYALNMEEDVIILCEGDSLALLACHEGDVHVHSPNEQTLLSCESSLRRLGLNLYPGGTRVVREMAEEGNACLPSSG